MPGRAAWRTRARVKSEDRWKFEHKSLSRPETHPPSCRPALVAMMETELASVLERRLAVPAPDTAWVTDITDLWTLEGWLYRVVMLDLFSRRVVGWTTRARTTRQPAIDALTMALARRCPPRGLIHHNGKRRHSLLGDLSPVAFERRHDQQQRAA